MKYLWTSHMCAFTAFGVCGKEMWTLCLRVIHCNTEGKVRSRTHIRLYRNIKAALSHFYSFVLKITFLMISFSLELTSFFSQNFVLVLSETAETEKRKN